MSKDAPPPYEGGPPPPGMYPPGSYPPPPHHGGPPPQTVIVTTPSQPIILGSEPIRAVCPHCHANITSSVDVEANTKTHLFALLLCFFGCWPCCCIPYCMDSCQSKRHSCPNCKAFLGTYSD